MKHKYILLFSIIVIALIGGYAVYSVFNLFSSSLQNLPKGELVNQIDSPDKDYTFKVYLCNGGATTDYAIRGEVNFNRMKKKPKNIYWQYHQDNVDVKWVDNEVISINGLLLNVLSDEYDYREY